MLLATWRVAVCLFYFYLNAELNPSGDMITRVLSGGFNSSMHCNMSNLSWRYRA